MLAIPILVLLAGAVVVMIVLARSLKSLDAEAGQAWELVQAERAALADAACAAAAGAAEETTRAIEQAAGACRTADTPYEAQEADDALAALVAQLPETDARSAYDGALERVASFGARYNNRAISYNNAGVTFPALLIAKRVGFLPRESYQPKHGGTDLQVRTEYRQSPAKPPRIMNQYMLWTVGLGETTMEEAGQVGREASHQTLDGQTPSEPAQ